MPENPYQAPATGASDDIGVRYVNAKRQRRHRMLGGMAIVVGSGLLLLAWWMLQQPFCQRVGIGGTVSYVMEYDRRPALLIGAPGAALLSAGLVLMLAAGRD